MIVPKAAQPAVKPGLGRSHPTRGTLTLHLTLTSIIEHVVRTQMLTPKQFAAEDHLHAQGLGLALGSGLGLSGITICGHIDPKERPHIPVARMNAAWPSLPDM